VASGQRQFLIRPKKKNSGQSFELAGVAIESVKAVAAYGQGGQ
jgi:hypothetical protein